MSRNVLLTGASGFIGKKLLKRLLDDGFRVCVLVRKPLDMRAVHNIDALNCCIYDGSYKSVRDAVVKSRPSVVLHLASKFVVDHSQDDIVEIIRSNVEFPSQLLEAMSEQGCKRFINTGTSWQHFNTSLYRPVNFYAASKQAFEAVSAYYQEKFDFSILDIKLFDTYGPQDSRKKLIDILIDAGKKNEAIDISPGEQVIDLLHVEDVVDGFVKAVELIADLSPGERRSYFLSGERVRVKELALLVKNISGAPINIGGRPYRDREVMVPAEPDPVLPDWKPKNALASYLKKSIC